MQLFVLFHSRLKAPRALIALALSLLLTSCASKSEPCVCTTLPASLIAPMERTQYQGDGTYGDVTQYAVILKRERDICLNRVDKLRQWWVEYAQH